jgi:hypothetical protein
MKITIPIVIMILMFISPNGLISLIYGQQEGGGPVQKTVINQAFYLGYRAYQSVGFEVPADAQNILLSGSYKINGVDSPIVGVYVVDGSQCAPPTFDSCPAIYLNSHELSASGSIHLDPGKSYYLGFVNEGNILLGPGGIAGTVVAHFVLSYNIP